jgi:hypothetical protein
MERKILAAVLAFALVLGLGACGAPAATNTENAGTTAAEPAASAEPAAEPAAETEPAAGTEPAAEAGSEPEATEETEPAAETDQAEQKEEAVSVAVTGLKASTAAILLFEDQNTAVSVTVLPDDATDKSVTWSSSDPSVAEVDQEGNVTAKAKGRTTIVATANDGSGITASTTVTVEPKTPLTVIGFGFSNYDTRNNNFNNDDANRFNMTVRNQCIYESVRNFDFELEMQDFVGNTLISSGNFSIGNDIAIQAGGAATVDRVHSGMSQTYKVTITITRVRFYDGTEYEIPADARQPMAFTRP